MTIALRRAELEGSSSARLLTQQEVDLVFGGVEGEGDGGGGGGGYTPPTFNDPDLFGPRRDWTQWGDSARDWLPWRWGDNDQDSDGDGVPDYRDRLPGLDDRNTFGIELNDGTAMIQNANGTWTAYQGGEKIGDFRLAGISNNSGSSHDVTVGGYAWSNNGTTWSWIPINM